MALRSLNRPLGKTDKFAQFPSNTFPRLRVIARSVPWSYAGLAQHPQQSSNQKTYTSTSLCFSRSVSDNKADRLATYPLGRDSQASIRLYLQYWMWRYQLGYQLHPTIPAKKDSLKIADIGCGTGIWLIELAEKLPSTAQLDGFDISTAQFPAREWLPKNVNLTKLNALAPIPEHLIGKYDIVHIGLFVSIVQDDDPLPLLDNLLLMLKPGGYLQWDEGDLGGLYRLSPNPSISHASIDKIRAKIIEKVNPKNMSLDWVRNLDKFFARRNMTVLANEHYPIRDGIAHPWTLMQLMTIAEQIRLIDPPRESADDWWKGYRDAAEEVAQGVSIRTDMIVAVGRKHEAS